MAIWLIFALMTGLAIVAVLWPLSRRIHTPLGQVDERRFYEQRIAEIDRDARTGYIGPAEADSARAEAARRLLRERRNSNGELADGESEYALRRRRAASAIALSTIPLITLAIYGAKGSPDIKSVPIEARLAAPVANLSPSELVVRMERHLAANPADGAGWALLAPVYQRVGRPEDAVKAWANVLRLEGETPARLSAYGEALVANNNGMVDALARELFERAAKADPSAAMAKFYLAVAMAQDGNVAGARSAFEALLAGAPADATWRGAVEARIAGLPATAPTGSTGVGGDADQVATARQDRARDIINAPPDAQKRAIAGMVETLAGRLKANPDDPDGWRMLIRSYAMLGQKEAAKTALADAASSFVGRPQEIEKFKMLGRELGLAPGDD